MKHVLFQHMHTVVKLADIAVRRIPSRLSSRYQHNSGFCKVNAAERGVILTKDVVEGCYLSGKLQSYLLKAVLLMIYSLLHLAV